MSNILKHTKRGLTASLLALLVTFFQLGSQVALAASWQVVSSPSPGTFNNVLTGVTAVSATNLWAVGFDFNSSGPLQTLIEHWNGKNWQVFPSPNAGTGDNSLTGVAAVGATNLWAVGYYKNSSGNNQTLTEEYS